MGVSGSKEAASNWPSICPHVIFASRKSSLFLKYMAYNLGHPYGWVSSSRYAQDLRSVRVPTLEMSGDASRTNSVFQL
jgi:hypothetical protein